MAKKKSISDKDFPRAVTAAHHEVAVSREYRHSGPIPDPHTLRMYDELLPGAANRILVMAEEQAQHRKEMEKTVIRSRAIDSLLGIISGFIIALATLILGVYVIVQGYQFSGTLLGSAGLASVVGVFIYGTRSSRKERQNKQQQ